MRFLIESLQDLDNQLRAVGGRLYVFRNSPVTVFRRIWEERGLYKLSFEQVGTQLLWFLSSFA